MRKRIVLGIMVLTLFVSQFSFVSYADRDETISEMQEQEAETKATITDLEKQTEETQNAISELRNQREQTQQSVSNLENQKGELTVTINGYSNRLSNLNAEISEAESAMAQVSSEIVELNNELADAQKLERDRYELLKKRLRSTYESGGTSGLLRIILESGTLSEFLTKFEYLNAIIR